jgi:PKHD-type hydroxylase
VHNCSAVGSDDQHAGMAVGYQHFGHLVIAMKQDYLYWEFPAQISKDHIQQLLQDSVTWPTQTGRIGEKREQALNIRQVTTRAMSEYHPISLQMYALAYMANDQCWRYKLGGPTQLELLRYAEGGDRYDAHVDTARLSDDWVRKLTVILMLNDDYEGGRFYFQQDLHHRQYINTEAGKVLVFPSHIMHGVEPLELGVRHSVVAWISGPDFK